ncbi:MAG: threonine--tRNA ligase [Buchnera aphidicola (Pentalonia nigronervosa)]|jgi:threonyl-tRNA synthetase|uniref:Threonine--tRNA ligase n=1 Tax=Buchnera aphidicola (Pentalonia nigronervosa) TaxID=1309793 RepID=A0A7H1AZF3_9GAMM|nr:MAG: threonine--tRNA ligase [Buchnera aphidicola (Pentalonia nigronervosa)]
MPVIRFCDGSQQVYKHSIPLIDIIKNKQPNLIKSLISISVNNCFSNLDALVFEDSYIELITNENNSQSLNILRCSCIQLLNYAIKIIWPVSKMVCGHVTSHGFYCDIDLDYKILKKDLFLLEKTMNMLIQKKYNILNKMVTYNYAIDFFNNQKEYYKVFWLNNKKKDHDIISLYHHENYVDLDIGMQVFNIKFCRHFKLQKIGGIYWQKERKNKILQRIYGTAWLNQNDLENHLNYLRELKKRDHRKIGKFLKFYHMQEESPGMIFWHNYGLIIFHELEQFVRDKLKKYEYQEVKTPLLIDRSIWEKSGHWDNYKNSIFTTLSEHHEYCIKPMNCPGHVQIFNSILKSYRDLPIRMAEFGSCHRNEPSGSLHGLMRIRNFTQDDAHIFCTAQQVRNEINHCIEMIYDLYDTFNFKNILVKLSTRPKKRIGSDAIWDKSEKDLSEVLIARKINFEYQPEEGAFYGPKIEFVLQDSLNRHWQCGTIQLDFYLPHRLHACYVSRDNTRETPIIIHRAILGSIERFIGILIEECSGNLPTWLSPVQVVIVSILDNFPEYVKKIAKKMSDINVRVKLDLRKEKIGFKIREYVLHKIPYILICGEKEVQHKKISIRCRNGYNFNMIDVDIFIEQLKKEIITRKFSQMEE